MKRCKQWKMDTWKVRSLYRTGAFKTKFRELERYRSDLVRLQEVTRRQALNKQRIVLLSRERK